MQEHTLNASYPLELPYRLINMYSQKGDFVLDPFMGLGTTAIAAILTERNSVGFEIDPLLKDILGTVSVVKANALINEKHRGTSLCALNTESHGSIIVSEGEIDTAIRITIDMYLFVTATNITELEMAGHYPKEEESASTISIEEAENKNESAYMAAES